MNFNKIQIHSEMKSKAMWGMARKFSKVTDFEKDPNINLGNEELSKV